MDNIFLKKTEQQELKSNSSDIENIKVSKVEILKSIPVGATKTEQKEKKDTHTEWRWRIFKFPNGNDGQTKESIEISYVKPNEKRLYVNKNAEWVNREIGPEFDKFVVEQFYHYTN
jgi:hypothetical protein